MYSSASLKDNRWPDYWQRRDLISGLCFGMVWRQWRRLPGTPNQKPDMMNDYD